MIDGEIYTKVEDNLCTFAFRDIGVTDGLYHYIGVNNANDVKKYGDRHSTGYMGVGEARLATDEEVERFKRLFKQKDYYWNKANKKLYELAQENYYEKDYYRSNSIHCVSKYRIMDVIRCGF